MICVFREEKDGPEGAAKAVAKSGFSPILLDTPVNKTAAYSQTGFATYLIGKDGKVKAELIGTKKKRPVDQVLEKVNEVFK